MFGFRRKVKIQYSALTDIGRKYENNEDSYMLPDPDEKFGITGDMIARNGRLFILCDGMGGANSGEVASSLSSGWIAKEFYNIKNIADFTVASLKGIIVNVNHRIFDLAQEHEQYAGMGTTCVALWVRDNQVMICSVGDSRCYRLRNNILEQKTEDQSEVWPLYKSGEISKEELRNHPRGNVILQAVGHKRDLSEDDINGYIEDLKKKDIYLICSDGLSDMVREDDIKGILCGADSLDKKCEKLISKANENGGRDNITTILIEVVE